jgi:hypothetical protein
VVPMTVSGPVRPLLTDSASAVTTNTISTLAEIRAAIASDGWPSRGLALRSGVLVTDHAMSSVLMRIAAGRYLRAARVWLQIAYYLDGDQLIAALDLAAQCAAIGGNPSFARNCVKRAEAAERQRHLDPPATDVVAS